MNTKVEMEDVAAIVKKKKKKAYAKSGRVCGEYLVQWFPTYHTPAPPSPNSEG